MLWVMRLDPVSLRLFIAVLEQGSITAAAEREHIAAASVSKRVSELEALLKARLLTRSNKGVGPTAAGAALRSMARGVLHELDNIEVSMRAFAAGVRGQVRVYANISTITQFLPESIHAFLAAHPDVQINSMRGSASTCRVSPRKRGGRGGVHGGRADAGP